MHGRIRVYGTDVRDWNRDHLLLQCSYGAQNRHVLHDTVRENLFPTTEVTEVAMLKALHDVGLPNVGLDDMGTDLSEGQRQRLALARILLDTAPIVVLDEPLSGVDILTFADVQAKFREWLTAPEQSRTVVLISHRLSFASLAQQVVVLGEGGRVSERGGPEELQRENPTGPFARMWTASSASGLGGEPSCRKGARRSLRLGGNGRLGAERSHPVRFANGVANGRSVDHGTARHPDLTAGATVGAVVTRMESEPGPPSRVSAAGATVDVVVAGAAVDRVGSVTALDHVHALATAELVAGAETVDLVCPAERVDHVDARRCP